eukprot:gene10234-13766_t
MNLIFPSIYSIRLVKNLRFRTLSNINSLLSNKLTSISASSTGTENDTGDLLITGLNSIQDISVKAVSCREIIQEIILRNDLSPQSSKALGELVACSLMMGAGLKGEETLQVNLVGDSGVRNMMAITDGNLKVRGMLGQPKFSNNDGENIRLKNLLGEGQVQVVRNHPSWKVPMNGIVQLRDVSIALNLALYMTESEQRSAFLLTDVKIDGNLCRHALGVMVERLPGAIEENIELSIKNLENVERKGLRQYLERSDEERTSDNKMFRDFSDSLNKIVDDCIVGMDADSIRWSKQPKFKCSCGVDRVWRALCLLPKSDIQSIVDQEEEISMKCEFCSEVYKISKEEIIEKMLANKSE